jgi:hypothetical protein
MMPSELPPKGSNLLALFAACFEYTGQAHKFRIRLRKTQIVQCPTNRFKRLVNFLKLRKNIKQSHWHTFGAMRLSLGDIAKAGTALA